MHAVSLRRAEAVGEVHEARAHPGDRVERAEVADDAPDDRLGRLGELLARPGAAEKVSALMDELFASGVSASAEPKADP